MDYRYRLSILFKSGNLWEVGVPTRALGMAMARSLITKDAGEVELLTICDEKTGRVKTIDHKVLMN